jgi:hypothetical protein
MAKLLLLFLVLYFNAAFAQTKPPFYILDMVHNNPGEPLTKSDFNNPLYLQQNGYTGQVMNDFIFPHTAVTFKKLNAAIFPEGSKELQWVMDAAKKIETNIKAAHAAGIKVYYFTDIIVLPKKLVELYHDEICDSNGKISFERPKTIEIHKIMFDELFETFPDLDGLVIRTGETYLNNVPHHTGNGPITNGEESHVKLINLLREEICVKKNKKIFYRTWSFGGMHEDPQYYLTVVDKIETHPNLIFSIKHTQGDYQRTYNFNPTLGIGKHAQIVEVQCQREYEGKGAYPNYVMNGVINGFEEYFTTKPQKANKGLNDIKNNKNFTGIWSWSRGGGWVGPYISNEFWCKLNAYVISHWGADTKQTEAQIFNKFMKENGITGAAAIAFRKLCLLSAKAVLRGHESGELPFEKDWVWWMRDEFLAGLDSVSGITVNSSEGYLYKAFSFYYDKGLLKKAVAEKYEAVAMWQKIEGYSKLIKMKNKEDEKYLAVSSQYGLLLHQIIAEGWNVMALGFKGDKTGKYETIKLTASIKKYDTFWKAYYQFKNNNTASATLYKPYAFMFIGPNYHLEKGMGASVNKYRNIIAEAMGVREKSIVEGTK